MENDKSISKGMGISEKALLVTCHDLEGLYAGTRGIQPKGCSTREVRRNRLSELVGEYSKRSSCY